MVHLFYEDLATETLDALRNVPGPVDLLVTTDTGAKRQVIESVFSGFRIPLHLNELGLGYRFYLDNYTISDGETVLYGEAEPR